MSTFLIITFCITSVIVIFIGYGFLIHKKNKPEEFFSEALRNENSGYFEEAINNYQSALDEEMKSRFQNNGLKNKITEKIKILHTNIDYKNSMHIVR